MNCKDCKHWYNNQRLLNYDKHSGFCLNGNFNFNINTGRTVGVIDVQSQKDLSLVTGNPAHDFESIVDYHKIKHSRYLLQTSDVFGCIDFTKTKTK